MGQDFISNLVHVATRTGSESSTLNPRLLNRSNGDQIVGIAVWSVKTQGNDEWMVEASCLVKGKHLAVVAVNAIGETVSFIAQQLKDRMGRRVRVELNGRFVWN